MTIKLGDKVRDKVTGFEGIAIANCEWLYGCNRITVQPVFDKKLGKVPDTMTFDEPALEVIKAGVAAPKTKTTTGGWQDDKASLRR